MIDQKNQSTAVHVTENPPEHIIQLHIYCDSGINDSIYVQINTADTLAQPVNHQCRLKRFTYRCLSSKNAVANFYLPNSWLPRHPLTISGQHFFSLPSRSPGLWGKKQKNAEKKQPCKLKHDCFTTANKFQVKTLGVNKKKFLDREKYPL